MGLSLLSLIKERKCFHCWFLNFARILPSIPVNKLSSCPCWLLTGSGERREGVIQEMNPNQDVVTSSENGELLPNPCSFTAFYLIYPLRLDPVMS